MSYLTPDEEKLTVFLLCLGLLGLCANYLFRKISPSQQNISAINQNIGRLNLNTASKEALLDIPGIGEKLAQRIIEYRDKYGPFRNTEELKNIKGITAYRFGRIKDYLYVK
ncbi:MAG: helix-hairpin-helix domain-containing protein [Candidatus Omnitrophica bacterium]|nr:helix-hairpin-helix domain-containing protein [Candidatus Omnitrophota bacterium]